MRGLISASWEMKIFPPKIPSSWLSDWNDLTSENCGYDDVFLKTSHFQLIKYPPCALDSLVLIYIHIIYIFTRWQINHNNILVYSLIYTWNSHLWGSEISITYISYVFHKSSKVILIWAPKSPPKSRPPAMRRHRSTKRCTKQSAWATPRLEKQNPHCFRFRDSLNSCLWNNPYVIYVYNIIYVCILGYYFMQYIFANEQGQLVTAHDLGILLVFFMNCWWIFGECLWYSLHLMTVRSTIFLLLSGHFCWPFFGEPAGAEPNLSFA